MGKKNKATGLGKSLIRDRFGKQNRERLGGDTFLHTSDLNDGYDWGRLNLQSVTEQNNLEDFLSTAELAGTEFTAEKMNIKVIQKDEHGGLPHGEELVRIENLHRQHKDSIRIPRRPHWDREMSAFEVDKNERAAFLEWRRSLALLQEVDGIVLTPYEKNLDFWRQLWRVIERSDVIVQIVDARNPLLFYCPDLEVYVPEVDPTKQCVVLINKADFLTIDQREAWVDYFNKRNVRVAFWSAMAETQRQEEALKQEINSVQDKRSTDLVTDVGDLVDTKGDNDVESEIESDDENDDDNDSENSDEKDICDEIDAGEVDHDEEESHKSDIKMAPKDCDASQAGLIDNAVANRVNECHIAGNNLNLKSGYVIDTISHVHMNKSDHVIGKSDHVTLNNGHMYTGPELLDFFRSLRPRLKLITVGMVGYPNVGKSSTINAILKMKKVPVSATPGRTKHFQTLFVDRDLMLCDCPGLVFPSFVTTKADLVVSGILPIDQMRDHVPPTSLICNLIPRRHLEKVYGIIISKPREGEDPGRRPTAEEFLNAYGAMRGYMNARGLPDCPRSSRYVLKDYVNGKLLFCHPPPGINPEDFNSFSDNTESTQDSVKPSEVIIESSSIDKEFFQKDFPRSHTRTAKSGCKDAANTVTNEKPWRKHNNRKKKEKLRRVYAHLDKH